VFAFALLDVLFFNNPWVLELVLDKVVTKDLLRDALENLYTHNPSAVDDELVESFFAPAKMEGAPEALRQIYTNDPGLSPMDLHAKHPEKLEALPIHLIWGASDVVTPIGGDVGTFYSTRAADPSQPQVTMDSISAGHVPMDDNAAESHASLLQWLSTLQ
jgi:pimeloyl-ACP methyl ester carboxylesterase